ncbi:MAG TPA: CocE/NonD family hydrolase [Solirubrobacterales bacterium]|nr:CocE/NonD family hydrolase [Solirubrobacterales bacterium]
MNTGSSFAAADAGRARPGRSIPGIAIFLALLAVIGAVAFVPGARAEEAVPWAKRNTGYLPARDGTLLKYSVLLPAGKGPFPAVMNYSGYDPGSIGGTAYRQRNTTMSNAIDAQMLKAGYAVIGVNMAGTGCSEGEFSLMSDRWATDGYDAVEWTARQSWSDGRVGMANWSFAGLSQVMTATKRPPHLRAIAPGMAVTDPWRDVGFPGGVTNTLFPATWSFFIQSRWGAAGESAIAEGDTRCEANIAAHNDGFPEVSPGAELTAHPYPEGEFADRLIWKRTHRINVPVLSMVAWQDESTGPRAGYFQDTLDPKRTYLVGSNGPHNIYVSERYRRLMMRFFDRYLKGERNGFEKEPHLRLWLESSAPDSGDPVYGGLTKLKPGVVITRPKLRAKVKPLRLSLRSGGRLTHAGPGRAEPADGYSYPRRGPAVNAYLGSADESWEGGALPADGTLAYTTAPLKRTLTFYGPASLDLWLSSTAADADVQATVTEVRPDGREMFVQRGWLRLSQRALERKRSTPLVPFHRRERFSAMPMKDSAPIFARLEIQRFAHIFRRGSSIRILLDTPSTTGGWDFDSPDEPSAIRIFHDRSRPSRLVLGLLRKGAVGSPRPACGDVLQQPCRADDPPVPAAHP